MTPTEGQTTTEAKGRKTRPLTEPMIRILKNVNATRDPLHGFAGAAERGGANHSLIALYRRGYLTDDVHGASVTDAGLAALAAYHRSQDPMSQTTTPSVDANRTARDLLAAEYEREGIEFVPNAIRTDPILTTAEARAVRAIVAALARNAELEAERDASDKYTWADGFPPKHHAEEWFLADTKFGPMALRNLPEEYAHDYTSADHTYVMQDTVKRWMQLPDSEFIAYASKGEIFELRAERDALAAENKVLREDADKRGRIIDLLESDLTQALLGEGFDMWEERKVRGQPRKRHRLPELVQDAILKMREIDLARTPAKENGSCDSAT